MFGRYWIIFRAMGLAAFHDTEGPFRHSWPSLLPGYALAVSSVSIAAYKTANGANRFKSSSYTQSAKVVVVIDKATLLISSIVSILSATFNTKNLFYIVNKFEHDRILKKYASRSQKRFKKGLLLWLFMILLMISELIYSRNYPILVPLFYICLLIYGNIFMFTSSVLTLHTMFRNLNRKLTAHFGRRDCGPAQILPLVDYVEGMSSTKRIQGFDALREMSAVHLKLCMLGNDINEAFNGQMMAIFIVVFARTVTRPYFIFLSLEYSKMDPVYIAIDCAWILVYWSQLFLSVWSCSLATNEARSTPTIVIHNLNKPLPPENRELMEMFLLQLVNNKLRFTVYRLFTIELSILTSVAGAVTTYLVILIQFQNFHP